VGQSSSTEHDSQMAAQEEHGGNEEDESTNLGLGLGLSGQKRGRNEK
jgi:hypothetical protein